MRPVMNKVVYIFCGLAMMSVGCKRPSAFVNEMEAFAEEACACQSQGCLDGISAKYEAWLKTHQNARGSQEDLQSTQEAQSKYAGCVQALKTAN